MPIDQYLLGMVTFAIATPLNVAAVVYMLRLYGAFWYQKTYPRLVVINSIGGVIQNIPLFLMLVQYVQPSYATLYAALIGWTINTQTLYHIILNRTSVMWRDRSQARASGLWLHAGIAVINVSVLIIWPSAQLGTWDAAVTINNVWDKLEKFLFMGIDVVLNALFVTAFRRYGSGHGGGLGVAVPQYQRRFERIAAFGEALAALGLLCDVLIIVLIFQPDPLLYTAGHVLAAPVKLWLEIFMADLVRSLVARGGNAGGRAGTSSGGGNASGFGTATELPSMAPPAVRGADDKIPAMQWGAAGQELGRSDTPAIPVKLHPGLQVK
ncbi:hypothetical protein HK405_005253 [Cladochytrium tenue]|nr:hypothetical protein HK405_005253 [Cladochytrium tenue]